MSIRTVACLCPTNNQEVQNLIKTKPLAVLDPLRPLTHEDLRNFGLLKSYAPAESNPTFADLFCHQYNSWNEKSASSASSANDELWEKFCESRRNVELDHPSYYFNPCERNFAPINKAQAFQIASIEMNQNKEQNDVERST